MGKRKGNHAKDRPEKRAKTDFTQVKSNPILEEYYRIQLLLPPADHSALFETLKSQLPVTFRINNTLANHQTLTRKLLDPGFLSSFHLEGCEGLQLREVTWCPGHLIWELNSNRSDLKRSPAVRALHEFIQKATDCWLISRQELVSMLPPLMLDIHPGQKVLDMCAAPGSKTAQLIELLQGSGLVVANDVDINRAFMMIHQLHRSNTTGLLVTNHPAQQLPYIGSKGQRLLFDRVLCDVPCSGDGTIRKTPNKWRTWNIRDAVNLHSLQIKIALRGLDLCVSGGLLLYSTCSLNPIEDESVVNAILTQAGPTAVLEDLPHIIDTQYPGLRYRTGLQTWKVVGNAQGDKTDSAFVEYTGIDQFPQKGKYAASMLPGEPNPELAKCVRILPQDQNTGGFFLALIRKKGSEIDLQIDEDPVPVPQTTPPVPTTAKKQRKVHKGISQYVELPEDSEEFRSISDYYGLSPVDFPISCLLAPSETHKKNIYYISEYVRTALDLDARKALRVINMGVKAFSVNKERASTQDCRYRICQDAVPFLSPFVTKRKCRSASRLDFYDLINLKFMKVEELRDKTLQESLGTTNGYFILIFQVEEIDEQIVVLKHVDARLVLMLSDEYVQGLKIRYEIPPSRLANPVDK